VSGIWIVFPPWLYAVLVSLIGRWGQSRWIVTSASDRPAPGRALWPADWSTVLITNLVFLSLIPTSLLSVIGALLPFNGARAGLSLGLLAFMFGCVPSRLLHASESGWDLTLWLILIDLLRVGGALAIVGFLVA
jgi:hypothetical protein